LFQYGYGFIVAFVKTIGALNHADGGLDGGKGLEGMDGGDRTLTEFLSVFKHFTGKGAGEMGENGARGKGALTGEIPGYLLNGVVRDTKED